jgi:hypothetical protein
MTTPNDLAAYKKMLQEKITALQFLGSNLKDTKRIAIQLTFNCESRVLIEQRLIPFNLEMELRTLIDDSIDFYQRQLVNANTGNYEQI